MDSLDSEPTFEEMTQVDRGARAKLILEDPLVIGALSAIERAVYDAFQSVPIGSVRELEHLHNLNWSVQKFKAALTTHVNDGVLAADTIQAKERSKSIWQRAKEKAYGTH